MGLVSRGMRREGGWMNVEQRARVCVYVRADVTLRVAHFTRSERRESDQAFDK